jgi:hypothetical protein
MRCSFPMSAAKMGVFCGWEAASFLVVRPCEIMFNVRHRYPNTSFATGRGLVGVSVTLAVGMFVVGKIASELHIRPGDTGKFLLISLFVVPSVGLLVGSVRLAKSSRGWRRGVAAAATVVSSLLVAVMMLFIVLGVFLIGSDLPL